MRLILPAQPTTALPRWGMVASAALHAIIAAIVIAPSLRSATPDRLNEPIAAVTVTRELPRLPATPDEGWDIPPLDAEGGRELRIEDYAFDTAKIRSRQTVLFPFLTLELTFLDRATDAMEIARRQFVNPYAPAVSSERRPPLALGEAALRHVIDRAWSRRGRWRAFGEVAALIDAYHPDVGRVHDVLRGYVNQNVLQPFCDTSSRDPRFWAMLENAADHADFLRLGREVATNAPSSRSTTELLFLLEKLANANRDTLILLLDTSVDHDLSRSTLADSSSRALVSALQAHYGAWLREEGLDSLTAIRKRYDEIRLRLLATIVETTPVGYRAGDARFLAGAIAFRRGEVAEALRWWRPIQPDAADIYVSLYSQVLDAIRAPRVVDGRRVERILANVHGRWRVSSIDRLRQFGYACDAY
jgi:hypothetical protein